EEWRLESLRGEARNGMAEQLGGTPDLDPSHRTVGEAGRAHRHLREHHGRAFIAPAADQARRLSGVGRHEDALWMQDVHRLLVYAGNRLDAEVLLERAEAGPEHARHELLAGLFL